MTHLLKRSGFYRNLQDWHDFWLLEGAVHWLREGRLLIYDLREIPGSWNPVVLVRGERSPILSAETFAQMAEALPGAHAVTVRDTGHAPTLDEPEVRAAIDAMLAQAA